MSTRKKITARDVQENLVYTTELNRKIKVVKINRVGPTSADIIGLQVLPEGSSDNIPIAIAADTILYTTEDAPVLEFEKEQVVSTPVTDQTIIQQPAKETQQMEGGTMPEGTPEIPNKPTKGKKEKAPAETGPKMSEIINPMIFAGTDAEQIADAVIAQFPDKKDQRDKLIQQIKGPRTYNLWKKSPEKFSEEAKRKKEEAASSKEAASKEAEPATEVAQESSQPAS
jgi:hypothetical protein